MPRDRECAGEVNPYFRRPDALGYFHRAAAPEAQYRQRIDVLNSDVRRTVVGVHGVAVSREYLHNEDCSSVGAVISVSEKERFQFGVAGLDVEGPLSQNGVHDGVAVL